MANNTVIDDEINDEPINEVIQDISDDNKNVDTIVNPKDPDGPSTTTETTQFTDEGGTYERGPLASPNTNNVNAGNPVHQGVDQDTE
jgi:hypothetical protein